ncbi:Phosphatidylserine decarboxylase [hydrothermal vent metagenome]|uniref:phosphatidylserine decarboxylase n=1 Tax=hydrothermal vent metagenome TaxID=652676 RepID=A0A3B1DWN5_9ZZZZ
MTKRHISNKISNLFHKFAQFRFSTTIQNIINIGYVKLFGLDMREFGDTTSYKTLNELFTRSLKVPRKFDNSLDTFISPTDSIVSQLGEIDGDIALQIKGMEYCVKELLTNNITKTNLSKITNGLFLNMYLSPKDYHRYHAPYNAKITKLIHIPGKLYPVNFKYLNKQSSLFVENERVILECVTSENKLFYMVFVGALNVGQMVFGFEPKVETNSTASEPKVYKYKDLYMTKGDCLGYFKMGSTVLMFWEKKIVSINLDLLNKKIKFGDVIANNI